MTRVCWRFLLLGWLGIASVPAATIDLLKTEITPNGTGEFRVYLSEVPFGTDAVQTFTFTSSLMTYDLEITRSTEPDTVELRGDITDQIWGNVANFSFTQRIVARGDETFQSVRWTGPSGLAVKPVDGPAIHWYEWTHLLRSTWESSGEMQGWLYYGTRRQFTSVPEPGALSLVGCALAGLLLTLWRSSPRIR